MSRRSIAVLLAAVVGAAAPAVNADTDDNAGAGDVAEPAAAPAGEPVAEEPALPPPPIAPELRRTQRTRAYHAVAIGALATAYALSEFAFKDTFAPDECGWCNPPGADRSVRDALVWSDVEEARLYSNISAYGLQPLMTLGVLALSGGRYGTRRVFDDLAPVLQSAAAVAVVGQAVKFTFGRARPFVRFGDPDAEHHPDDNLSFWSGHTSFTFALAVSAGTVAHRRHYKAEPLIWAGGLALAATSGYMRIAGDKHYFSDVVVGAIVGSAFGYFLPTWLHDDVLGEDVNLVPSPNGIALTGTF